ncbi:hypothetical protein [Anabaena sp. UHCC 0253]|uniref:hypothetical protein n=1 Tax=Anabaena sp. UHCC 0253 TaxID=2590019 RepID=UPI0020C46930|nr:hypothetical protein [Anabaena sp. UHCC 0253]
MTDCFIHTFPGEQIRLVNNPLEDLDDLQLATLGVEFIQEFYSFIQPLSADLMVVFRDTDWSAMSNIAPLLPHWYIQALSAPSNIILGAGFTNPDPQVSQAPQLSPEILFNWIKTALEQDCTNPDYRITWRIIHIYATRTRLFNEQEFQARQSLLLNSNAGELNIPIERLEDGLWVSGPVKETSIEPPVTFALSQEYGGLSADMMIHWSLWTQPGQPEQIALQDAISRLLNKGWEKA